MARQNKHSLFPNIYNDSLTQNIEGLDQDNNKITNTMIEHRSSSELTHMKGLDDKGRIQKIRIYPEECKTLNPAFDMTPGEYVTGLITECGIFESSEIGLREYYSAAEANR